MTKLIVIDTETGGLDPDYDSILSIAGVVWEDGKIVDNMTTFVKERYIRANPEALEINQIKLDWLEENGLDPEKATRLFMEFVRKNFEPGPKVTVCGINVGFDVGFTKRLFILSGCFNYNSVFSHRVLDVTSVAKYLVMRGELPETCLDGTGLADHFGVKIDHTALGDAIATAEILTKLMEK